MGNHEHKPLLVIIIKDRVSKEVRDFYAKSPVLKEIKDAGWLCFIVDGGDKTQVIMSCSGCCRSKDADILHELINEINPA